MLELDPILTTYMSFKEFSQSVDSTPAQLSYIAGRFKRERQIVTTSSLKKEEELQLMTQTRVQKLFRIIDEIVQKKYLSDTTLKERRKMKAESLIIDFEKTVKERAYDENWDRINLSNEDYLSIKNIFPWQAKRYKVKIPDLGITLVLQRSIYGNASGIEDQTQRPSVCVQKIKTKDYGGTEIPYRDNKLNTYPSTSCALNYALVYLSDYNRRSSQATPSHRN